MKEYIRIIVFVTILGTLTSALLVGMDLLTAERIKALAAFQVQSTVLNAYGITNFSTENVNQVFDENIETIEINDLVFFVDNSSGAVSFEFVGNGVWGPIEGVLTLESDFTTIRSIAILQQEETPGLGGVIEEPAYLAKYEGAQIAPSIRILRNANPDDPNEVDAITGGTRTSERFEIILNEAYSVHRAAWDERMRD